jgi:hypothetical protein
VTERLDRKKEKRWLAFLKAWLALMKAINGRLLETD